MLTDIASVDDVIVDQADFNYGVEAFRTWFISVWVNYVTTFGVDGFRLASDLCILPINGVPLCSNTRKTTEPVPFFQVPCLCGCLRALVDVPLCPQRTARTASVVPATSFTCLMKWHSRPKQQGSRLLSWERKVGKNVQHECFNNGVD